MTDTNNCWMLAKIFLKSLIMDLFQSDKMDSLPSAPIPGNMIRQTILLSSNIDDLQDTHFQPSNIVYITTKSPASKTHSLLFRWSTSMKFKATVHHVLKQCIKDVHAKTGNSILYGSQIFKEISSWSSGIRRPRCVPPMEWSNKFTYIMDYAHYNLIEFYTNQRL